MCTYLYAAFSLKDGEADGLSAGGGRGGARWRRVLIEVAIEEMGHLTAVWNITAALGGSAALRPEQFSARSRAAAGQRGREARALQRGDPAALHLPRAAARVDRTRRRAGLPPSCTYTRGSDRPRLTPMALDYETVGEFYAHSAKACAPSCAASARQQRSTATRRCSCRQRRWTARAQPVICSKTALAAFDAIVEQGEGAPTGLRRLALPEVHRRSATSSRAEGRNPGFHARVSRGARTRCCAGRHARRGACGWRTRRRSPPSTSPMPLTG